MDSIKLKNKFDTASIIHNNIIIFEN